MNGYRIFRGGLILASFADLGMAKHFLRLCWSLPHRARYTCIDIATGKKVS